MRARSCSGATRRPGRSSRSSALRPAEPTVVSVVTRGRSDDCNSVTLRGGEARLRAARLGEACAFHLFTGGRWELVRHFSLGDGPLSAGFLAQSPTGQGCSASFEDVSFETRRLDDVRSGA